MTEQKNPRRTVMWQFIGMFLAAGVAGALASMLPAPPDSAAVYPDLAGAAAPARLLGLRQIAAVSTFTLIICATLMFEERRLGVAFAGMAALLALKVLTLSEFVHSTELHIILLLVGMMTLVGALKDMGFFTWIIQSVINARKMTVLKFIAILMLLSGVMPGIVDEVTSIVFVLALVFQVCDTLKLRPTPFVLMSVMATNIGSTGTMLGNPVGILIGTKAEYHWHPGEAGDVGKPLSFGDFIFHATPIMFLALVATFLVLLVYYRKDIRMLDERLAERRASHIGLGPMVAIPYKRGLAILVGALVFIASHHPLEHLLGLEPNTMLVAAPLAIAGLIMVFRSHRARHYVESSIEWWSLLFFMMLFAVSFALEHCGVTDVVADCIAPPGGAAPNRFVLTPAIVAVTAVGSAFVDNIVFVSTFIPIVKKIVAESPQMSPLWWSLLFGACFGGNVTAIGSTANLVAISMLGKRYSIKVAFLEWLKIGLVVGVVSCTVATLVILCYYKTVS